MEPLSELDIAILDGDFIVGGASRAKLEGVTPAGRVFAAADLAALLDMITWDQASR